jgi:type IV pilus assembly protein PilN
VIRINLLPPEERKARKRAAIPGIKLPSGVTAAFPVVVIGSAIVLCLLAFSVQRTRIRSLQAAITAADIELDRLRQELALVDELTRRQDEVRRRTDMIRDLNRHRFLRVHLMDEVSASLPDYLWLTSFREQDLNVYLQGAAYSNLIVADLMNRLEASAYLSSVDLTLLQKSESEGREVMVFEISCRAAPVEGGGELPRGTPMGAPEDEFDLFK